VADADPPTASADRFAREVVPEVDVMLRVARSLTRNPADAEDLVQDALVRAYRAIDSFDGRHPRAWLLTIVRNTHLNRNRRRRPSLLDDPDATQDVAAADPDASPESAVLGGELEGAIHRALAQLGDDARRVVELVDIADLTYAEAAEVLQIPVGTVMSRLHRARVRIREALRVDGLAPGVES
jgi:RNA polymerase sigma-70 factor (ECF subfamily)